jgi:hypothetical protein
MSLSITSRLKEKRGKTSKEVNLAALSPWHREFQAFAKRRLVILFALV